MRQRCQLREDGTTIASSAGMRPHARGRGYGRAILTQLAALAHERGCARMEWAVLDWNRSARDFYESLGARPVDGWVIYRADPEQLSGRGSA